MQTQPEVDVVASTIEFVRRNEGNFYGPGAADLTQDIVTAVAGLTDPEAIRDAIYDVCHKHSTAIGQTADIEVAKRDNHLGADFWVGWESGPHDWAIQVSMLMPVLAEPYYGFDLCFYRGQ